jgi:hypothetical protein
MTGAAVMMSVVIGQRGERAGYRRIDRKKGQARQLFLNYTRSKEERKEGRRKAKLQTSSISIAPMDVGGEGRLGAEAARQRRRRGRAKGPSGSKVQGHSVKGIVDAQPYAFAQTIPQHIKRSLDFSPSPRISIVNDDMRGPFDVRATRLNCASMPEMSAGVEEGGL